MPIKLKEAARGPPRVVVWYSESAGRLDEPLRANLERTTQAFIPRVESVREISGEESNGLLAPGKGCGFSSAVENDDPVTDSDVERVRRRERLGDRSRDDAEGRSSRMSDDLVKLNSWRHRVLHSIHVIVTR